MKINKLLSITLLCLFAVPMMAQTYTIRSFDTARVKKQNSTWRALNISDVLKIHLQVSDSVEVTAGTLAICQLGKTRKLKIAYPGKWSVKDICDGKALPSGPNTPGPGDSEKAESVWAVDFYTIDGKAGNVLHEGNYLSGIIVSNFSNEDFCFEIMCVDYGEERSPLYQLSIDNDAKIARRRRITVVPFNENLVVDNNKNTTAVIVVYSSNAITLPEFSLTTTLKELYARLDALNLRYAVRTITYNNE